MSFGGAVQKLNNVIKNNRALLPSQNKKTFVGNKHKDGKKPLKFKNANRATKKVIYHDKVKLQKQLRFRVGLLIVISIFVLLLFLLLYNFG